MKKISITKKLIPWLVMLPALALLFTGLLYLDRQSISLPLEYQKEDFAIRYGTRFLGYWNEGDFYAEKSVMETMYAMRYPKKIKKEQVEQLLDCLDMRKSNLRKRMKAWDEGGKKVTEISEKPAFVIYGLESGNVPLIITEDGQIYVNGYCYTGSRETIKDFFPEFLEEFLSVTQKELTEWRQRFAADVEGLEELTDKMLMGVGEIDWEQAEIQTEEQEEREDSAEESGVEARKQMYELPADKVCIFTPEITDEFYIMEYDRHFSNWSEGYFIASMLVNMPERSFSCIFPRQTEENGLSSIEVQDIYQTLDLKEENIGERCLWSFDSGVESLLFYGSDSNEGVLMITSYGDVYVKGYRYLGDKKAFIEKLNGFIQGLEKEWLSKEDKAFLVETVESIEWK